MRSRIWAAVAIVLLISVGWLLFAKSVARTRRPEYRSPEAPSVRPGRVPVLADSIGPNAPSRTRAPRSLGKSRRHSTEPSAPSSAPPIPPGPNDPLKRNLNQQALDNYKQWAKYPPSSRPASEQPGQVLPYQFIAAVRPLNPGEVGKMAIRQEQDRLYLVPGEVASVSLSAAVDGKAKAILIEGAGLVRIEGQSRAPSVTVAHPFFRDDGAAPDASAKDLRFTASVRPPVKELVGFTGDLLLIVKIRIGSEYGTVSFPFVYTGPPPARFTGSVREGIEDGSLALYVGVDVAQAGRYAAIGRLFDATGRPVAVLHFNDVIDSATRELRLSAFGKVLRDEQAVAPFTLRDVQGWRMLEQGSPDRQMIEIWPGPYKTARYADEEFSDREWDSPGKQRRIRAFEHMVLR